MQVLVDGSTAAFTTAIGDQNQDQPTQFGGHYYYTPGTTGAKSIKLNHRVDDGNTGTSHIERARIEVWRVA